MCKAYRWVYENCSHHMFDHPAPCEQRQREQSHKNFSNWGCPNLTIQPMTPRQTGWCPSCENLRCRRGARKTLISILGKDGIDYGIGSMCVRFSPGHQVFLACWLNGACLRCNRILNRWTFLTQFQQDIKCWDITLKKIGDSVQHAALGVREPIQKSRDVLSGMDYKAARLILRIC